MCYISLYHAFYSIYNMRYFHAVIRKSRMELFTMFGIELLHDWLLAVMTVAERLIELLYHSGVGVDGFIYILRWIEVLE